MNSVKIYYGKLQLPTYPLGMEDREPPLLREFTPRGATIYPYSTQEVLGTETIIKEYEAVYLENDYLKLTFLPELNGRLYSAFDKVNGNELFYANPSIKPGLFAVRGAWPAVGVEFNFPNSHTSTTLEPVQCETRQYEDGCASVIVGDIEQTCRMGWSVEVKLRPDSSAIRMESKLYNPTDLPQRFYYWVNAACPVYSDTEFIFPPSTRKLLTHPPMDSSRLARLDYPVHDNVDIRFFGNIKQHFPVFAENMEEDFFGLYHHRQNYGIAHVANHSLVRGRKLWTFGTARDGRIFTELLSDTGVDYCELQTGPFSLQSDYRLLHPGRMHIQRESWIPVAHTDGFNIACSEFAAKVDVANKTIVIRLCAAATLKHAVICLSENGREITKAVFDATPGQTISRQFYSDDADAVIFRDDRGEMLAVFNIKTIAAGNLEKNSSIISESPRLLGKYLEEQGAADQAEELYLKYADSNVACGLSAARLAFNSGCFDKSEKLLAKILLVERNNPEALILQGLIDYQRGEFRNAENAFSHAADDNRFRDRCVFYLASCAFAVRNYRRALLLIDETGRCGAPEARTLRLKALCLKQLGMDSSVAESQSKEIFAIDPVTDQAGELVRLRHYAEALDLLEQSVIEKNAGFFYYTAWLNHMAGNAGQSVSMLENARRSDWTDRFAFRLETEPVLRYALQECPDDNTANYQLGCLLASKNRWDEAAWRWQGIKNGKYHTDSCRNLALYNWKIQKNKTLAAEYFRKAAGGDVGGRTLLEAEMFFEETGDTAARLKLFSDHPLMLFRDSRLRLSKVKALLADDCPEAAFDLLINGNFSLCEGKMLSRRLYEQACSTLAQKAIAAHNYKLGAEYFLKAAEYPENIGIGKPSGNKAAEWQFKAGLTYLKLKERELAGKCFRSGAENGDWIDIIFFPLKQMIWEAPWERVDVAYWRNAFFRACCLARTGQHGEARITRERFNSYLDSLRNNGRRKAAEYQELEKLETAHELVTAETFSHALIASAIRT